MSQRNLEEFKRTAFVHLSELVRVATRMVGDRSVAEDLVQETFLQAWKSFSRFQIGTNARAWLFKILFFVHAHHRRKMRREPLDFNATLETEGAFVYDPPTPDSLLRDQVVAAFQQLPEPFRIVVTLADVEELTYKEIAEALGIPMGTVMSRLNRGRRLLRQELARTAEAMGLKLEK